MHILEIFLLLNKLLPWSEWCFCCFCHPAHGQQLTHKCFSQPCKRREKRRRKHCMKLSGTEKNIYYIITIPFLSFFSPSQKTEIE
jgi:hypothetical protein